MVKFAHIKIGGTGIQEQYEARIIPCVFSDLLGNERMIFNNPK